MHPIHRFVLGALAATASAGALSPPHAIEVVRELRLPAGHVSVMSWSPDGTQLAVGGMAGDVVVLDPAAREADRWLARERESGTVMDLCWSADGARLLAAFRGRGLVLFDVRRQQQIATHPDLRGPIVLAPATAGFVGLAADGNPVHIADLTLEPRARFELPPGGVGSLLALSPDGQRLAVAVTHTSRLFEFDLADTQGPRLIGDGEAAILGLGWPEGASSPWWLDSGANVLHAFGKSQRCVGREVVVQADGARVAVLEAEGWRLQQADGSVMRLGQEHGCLALPPSGEAWARAADGRIDFGEGDTVSSRLAPVSFEYAWEGQLVQRGELAVVNGNGPWAFAVATGEPLPTTGMPEPAELVRSDQGPELVWLQSNRRATWWELDGQAAPTLLHELDHAFLSAELAGSARLFGRWLVRGMHAVDVQGELPSPNLPRASGFLVPVRAGEARWVSARFGGPLCAMRADGTVLARFGSFSPPDAATDLGVSPDGSRVAVAARNQPAQVFDVASGQVLGRLGWFHDLRFVGDDLLIGAGPEASGHGYEVALWTIHGSFLARLPFAEPCQLLDVDPVARLALVAVYSRVLVLAWH